MFRTYAAAALLLALVAGCSDGSRGHASAAPSTAPPAPTRYLFYLHGKIIEDQGLPAVSPVHGEYRFEAILEAFESRGFVVKSEARPKRTDPFAYADRIGEEIRALLDQGVAADRITVVGASKGAFITAVVSSLGLHPDLRYVLLATCHSGTLELMEARGLTLSGHVLALRDAADTELAGSCAGLFERSPRLGPRHEVIVEVGTGHGILYQPLEEWLEPTARWAEGSDLP